MTHYNRDPLPSSSDGCRRFLLGGGFISWGDLMTTHTVKVYRISLLNLQTIGAACGYGVGDTRAVAIEAALKMAREFDPEAFYDGGVVCFRGGINC